MALITTVAEAKEHIRLADSYRVTALPNFDVAEADMVLPITGQNLYDAIKTAYDGDGLDSDQTELLGKMRAVAVPYAFMRELHTNHIRLNDTGPQVSETEDTRPMFRWEYEKLEDSLLKQTEAAQEALILYLKSKVDTFTDWKDAGYNATTECVIIRDGQDLKAVTTLLHPHRCYVLLRGLLAGLNETKIKGILGDAYYAVLHPKIVGNTTSEKETVLLTYLKFGLAHLAMAEAAIELNLRFDGNGVTIALNLKEQPNDGRATADMHRINQFVKKHNQEAELYFKKATDYLNANATDGGEFAEYYSSSLYSDPTVSTEIDNSQYDGIFRI